MFAREVSDGKQRAFEARAGCLSEPPVPVAQQHGCRAVGHVLDGDILFAVARKVPDGKKRRGFAGGDWLPWRSRELAFAIVPQDRYSVRRDIIDRKVKHAVIPEVSSGDLKGIAAWKSHGRPCGGEASVAFAEQGLHHIPRAVVANDSDIKPAIVVEITDGDARGIKPEVDG